MVVICIIVLNKIYNIFIWLMIVIIIVVMLYFAIRIFVVDWFRIPTESMMPTLVSGDNVVVDKTLIGARIYTDFHFNPKGGELRSVRTRGRRDIRHNDIVIFNKANHKRKIKFIINNVYCKRCIALPGDTISIVNGYYKNNNYDQPLGIEAEQERIVNTPDSILNNMRVLRAMPKDRHFHWTIRNFGPMYIPRKGDVMMITPESATIHKVILEWETGKEIGINWQDSVVTADGKPFKMHRFEHNYYFMAGDHVINSDDSRYKGPVPEEYIVGIVTHVINSEDPDSKETRWERIGRIQK